MGVKMVALPLYQLLLLLLLYFFGFETAYSDAFVVEYLPGFDGPLPFHLETGYVSVGEENDAQLFYYFVKSERNPEEDPVVLWLIGGPRCSGFGAFVYELGPLYFKDAQRDTWRMGFKDNVDTLPTLVLNPNSWTKVANIIFIDAPIGAGFSYSMTRQESKISDTISAQDTYQFIQKWFIDHPEFKSNPFYISGDSYSGIIVPIVVQEVIKGIEDGNEPPLNFKGYSLGNPVTDRHKERNAYVPYARGMGLISHELYESLLRNCKGEYDNYDPGNIACSKYRLDFLKVISGINKPHILEASCPTISKQKSSSQSRRSLTTRREEILSATCRSAAFKLSEYWMNDDRVRNALNIRKGTINKWVRCNYHNTDDENIDYGVPYDYNVKSSIDYHRNISNRGYRSLIYSGDHDMLVPFISTEAWVRSLNLTVVDDWHQWLVDEQIAGYTMSFSNGMTYATVKDGGHTAPQYKPRECLVMFKRWISNNPL